MHETLPIPMKFYPVNVQAFLNACGISGTSVFPPHEEAPMPYILDKATGETRGVSQAVYDQWIQQTDRFSAASESSSTPAVVEEAPSTASDLVGKGLSLPLGPLVSFGNVPVYGARGDGTDMPTDTIQVAAPSPLPSPQPEPTPET